MALSTTGLRDRIKTKLDTAFGALSEPGATYRLQFALAIAEAVVEEIQANGKARIVGVTPGPGQGGLQKASGTPTTAPDTTQEIPLV